MDVFKRWNLTVKSNLVEIPARELPSEPLYYSHTDKYESGPWADWTKHLKFSAMFKRAVIKQWAVLTPYSHVMEVRKFLTSLKKASDGMSFLLPQPKMLVPTYKLFLNFMEFMNKHN